MADHNAEELKRLGDKLFSKKYPVDTLWQTIAEQFYPERADFTRERIDGSEFAEHLVESVPAQNRRDLAAAMGAIMRPRGQKWYELRPSDPKRYTDAARVWLDEAGEVMRTHLYRPDANFRTSWQQGDDDFVSFGNAVHALTEHQDRQGIYFETFHLKDCAWAENRYRFVDCLHRKFKMTLRQMVQNGWKEKLTKTHQKMVETDPYHEAEVRVVVMPLADYDPYKIALKKNRKFRYVAVYMYADNCETLEERGYAEFPYVVRRWRLNTNSQYAYSPAAMLGLCDARLLQSQAQVILEAGEKKVDPPMIATRDAVLGGVNTYAGAVTWVDAKYDERSGPAIKALETGGDIHMGVQLKQDTREVLSHAWLINKLQLPGQDREMTAYETRERVSEYIRSAAPIFEPFEADLSVMLDRTFNILMRITMEYEKGGIEDGPFSPLSAVPQELADAGITFEFETPVQLAYRRSTALKAQEVVQNVSAIAQIKPEVIDLYDWDDLVRDATYAVGAKPKWLKPPEQVQEERDARAKEIAQAKQLEAAKQGADIAHTVASAMPKGAEGAAMMQQMQQQQSNQDNAPDAEQQLAMAGMGA